jgi:hypothetical protein
MFICARCIRGWRGLILGDKETDEYSTIELFFSDSDWTMQVHYRLESTVTLENAGMHPARPYRYATDYVGNAGMHQIGQCRDT